MAAGKVVVTGPADAVELKERIEARAKKPVQIVSAGAGPPKKEKDKEKEKDKKADGGEKKADKEKGGGGGGEKKADKEKGGGVHYPPAPAYAYGPTHLHAPQMFSDENPNACSVM
uniref:Heavy metal transport/detoxification superfamily protein n=1 Tax=Zea mays TaxID=4577 RepID=C4J6B3_MAIZE|nr:unknown [Zea mays]